MGKWMPICEEEWDGDQPVDPDGRGSAPDAGEVVFGGNQLPWTPGTYELRYHHDGKHNVMSRVAPIEIFGEWCTAFRLLLSFGDAPAESCCTRGGRT